MIDINDVASLRERSRELFSNIDRVMTPYYDGERGRPLQEYYLPCKILIEKVRNKDDFGEDFRFAIGFLKDSLEWE
jgi:hypothetical protein